MPVRRVPLAPPVSLSKLDCLRKIHRLRRGDVKAFTTAEIAILRAVADGRTHAGWRFPDENSPRFAREMLKQIAEGPDDELR